MDGRRDARGRWRVPREPDADSEGEEAGSTSGRLARCATRSRLASGRGRSARYGLDRPPNFEGRAAPPRRATLADVARAGSGSTRPRGSAAARREGALSRGAARCVRPGLDDKRCRTSWNALAIAGPACPARALATTVRGDGAVGARRAETHVVWRSGRFHATCRGGEPALAGLPDDHAFLLDALVEAMTRFLARRLRAGDRCRRRAGRPVRGPRARRLSGSRRTTTSGCPTARCPATTTRTPSGNGVAARALVALGHPRAPALRRGGRAGGPPVRAVDRRIARRLFDAPRAAHGLEHPPTLVGSSRATWRGGPLLNGRSERLAARRCASIALPAAGAPEALVAGGAAPPGARAWVCHDMTCRCRSMPLGAVEGLLGEGDPGWIRVNAGTADPLETRQPAPREWRGDAVPVT